MRKPTVLTSIALLFVVVMMSRAESAPKPAASKSGNAKNDSATIQPLLGKWIVRSVEHDKKPTGAQIGQKRGDIIKFAQGADGGIAMT